MPFCPECGNPVEPSMKHCPECGHPLKASNQSVGGPSYPQQPSMPQARQGLYGAKNPGLAAFLSLIIPGGGQIYLGNTKRGIMILALIPALAAIMFFVQRELLWMLGEDFLMSGMGFITGITIIALPSIVLYLWNVIDAYKQGKKYNNHVQQTGSPPW